MSQIADEQARLEALLVEGEKILASVGARTLFPQTKGLLAATGERLVYSSRKHSMTSTLEQLSTVSLTREGRRGTLRMTVGGRIQTFSTLWTEAQAITRVLRDQVVV